MGHITLKVQIFADFRGGWVRDFFLHWCLGGNDFFTPMIWGGGARTFLVFGQSEMVDG